MKTVKFFLFGCLFFVAGAANGQTFFMDSTVWFIYRGDVSLDWPPTYFLKDEIKLDSISASKEFYTVLRTPFIGYSHANIDSFSYTLIVEDSVVYYSGKFEVSYDSVVNVENLHLFDYKLRLSDTVKIITPVSDCRFLIDSIRFDSVLWPGKRYFFSTAMNGDACKADYIGRDIPKFASTYLGFNSGLLPLNFDCTWCSQVNMTQVCYQGNVLYLDSVFYERYGQANFNEYCNEDSFKVLAQVIISSSIKEPIKLKASIYPNPATEKLHIKLTEPKGNYQIQIFDVTGKKFTSRSIGSGEEVVDISALPKGIYLVLVTDGEGNFYSQKILKM